MNDGTMKAKTRHLVVVSTMMPHPDREEIPRQFDSTTLLQEVWSSTQLMFQNRISWLLLLGPIALVGDAIGVLGEPLCFAFSGIALIPCAERLSYVTEQVAAHTNGTIGALLNATFGNAPELLISTAALRSGFYRVTQLAMLGSMLTNLLFVFGLSCLVGGARYQVQELRITSGNVSVGMLLAATAGSLLPATLIMSGQLSQEGDEKSVHNLPSQEELSFSRVNAVIMMLLYMAYLTFQLGTHKEEFDDEDNVVETERHLLLFTPHYIMRNHGQKRRSQRNMFCLKYLFGGNDSHLHDDARDFPYQSPGGDVEMVVSSDNLSQVSSDESALDPEDIVMPPQKDDPSSLPSRRPRGRRRTKSLRGRRTVSYDDKDNGCLKTSSRDIVNDDGRLVRDRSHESDAPRPSHQEDFGNGAQMSLRTGVVWLLLITLCISAMSDILVDTIDGFAFRLNISEVFTSTVIVPFFSNVAEQVSAVLFAYRNKMDLCVGVTVGSAIQIALFVLPGCVLIGMAVDRSMTLYFRSYETCCVALAVIVVAAVLQGGTTNWLVGLTLIGIYVMMASGFWFHELEDLSTDAEIAILNRTTGALL